MLQGEISGLLSNFQLTSQDMQAKHKKYTRIPKIQQQIPAGLDETAQLNWLTEKATTELSQWLSSFQEELDGCDITCGHPELATAAEIVDAFRHSRNNALSAWSVQAQAAEYIKTLLRHLQLSPVECQSAEAAIMLAVLRPVDAQTEQFACKLSDFVQASLLGHSLLICCCVALHIWDILHQYLRRYQSSCWYTSSWACTTLLADIMCNLCSRHWHMTVSFMQAQQTVANNIFIQSLKDDLATLRAAAIASEHRLHIFDMDVSPPVCHVLPPFQRSFKVKGRYRANSSNKALPVKGSSWSPILGNLGQT